MKVKETLIVVLFCTIFTKCHGAIRFANYYNNHMVLQRAPQRANIWGFGTAGVAVSVKIDGLVVSTINVGADGVWKTLLPATTAGGPHNVSVTSSDGGAALSDVMFGDVWVCSGQSNMEYTLSGISNYTAYIDAAKSLHNIRLFRTNHKATDVPQVEPVVNTQWTIPDQHDAHTRVFSAVCLMYALELAPHLQRPLGLVETNWGGTPVEAWSSPDALAKCPQHKRRAVNAHSPSALWNGMVAPLLPMTIYGAIWYQGEANAGKAHLYACQFRAMIEDWRAKTHLSHGELICSVYIAVPGFSYTLSIAPPSCEKNPKTAGTGKRKAVQDQNTGNKQSRLAVLLADAISKDDEILSEIGELLGNKDKNKADGTEVPSISSESSDDECTSVSVSETSMHTAYAYEDISLGAFSAIHPPLDQKLIDKITNGEFVDFPYLLNKDHNNETTTIRKTNNATITSIQKSSPQPITEIGQWNRAFQMYADVYSAKYPTQAPHLFRYMSIIQHLANTSKHWQLYDEKFRKLRTVSPSIPWGIIHTETPFVAPLTTTQNFCQTKSCSEKVTVGITNSLGNAESQSALSPTIVATVKDPMALHVAQSHLICQRDTLSTHQTFKNQATLQPNSEKNFKLPTPVLINTLAPYLDGYDTDKTHFLVKGFNQGFSLGTADYIPPRSSKTVFPNTQVEVHGILVDTNSLTASLPPDKVQLLRTLLESFKKRKKVTLKQLQSLLGHLNFACKVIKPGRCFLRRLYDLTIGCTKPNHHIRLTSETRADIALWHTFLNDYNGCTLLTGDRFTTSTTLKLFTDAAGSKGFACTHGSSWTFGIFPQKVKEHHINILELYPIALAVNMFGHLWQNTNICFICDNMAVVYCLNKQSSKDKTMMKLIRNIVLSALENNFCFQAKHISTKKNTICDLLSRLQVQEALTLAPHLNKTPLPLPIQMSPLALLQ
ncbi:SIAE-like protein [Mya arenaria]|uniref:SIAE-like protein n=1 Tax=Mya arenaria TaxID=6604 RepID=A0ABY7DWE2_MYAAR|nr:SIAE-like protein [Mya arenaria]